MSMPTGRLTGITVDCQDPFRLAEFWAALVGGTISEPLPGWRRITVPGGGPVLNLQPVPEPKSGKTRVHVDVTVDDVDAAGQRIADLGGRWTGERHDYPEGSVLVMEDPESHEFCIVQYH